MTVSIWHNPRCSKSRQTLALLQENGLDPTVRLYLSDPPNTTELNQALAERSLPASNAMRTGEAAFKAAGLSKTDPESQLLEAMAMHPILIERPIVFAKGKAAIGRPPEAVLDLL